MLLVSAYQKAALFTKRQYIEYLIATTGNYTCTHLADQASLPRHASSPIAA